ncbi:MAG: receptor with intracellular metal dependent phosphohydrolase [Paenibacillaceae bacterium]|nr:receptor with intracellular metal dependent phosphohydrolase [Paenibacillaceae bacterium]
MIKNEAIMKSKFHYRVMGWKVSAVVRFLLFFVFALVFYFALSGKLIPETYDITKGSISDRTIYAPRQIEDASETEKAKEEAASAVQPVYQVVSIRNGGIVDALFAKIQQINGDEDVSAADKVSIYRTVLPALVSDFEAGEVKGLISIGQYSDALLTEMQKRLNEQLYRIPEETFFKFPKLTQKDLTEMEPVAKDIVAKLMNDQIVDAQTARAKVAELVNSSSLSKAASREQVQEIVRASLTPNKFFDQRATDQARTDARENTKPVYINKNDILVQKGDVISDEIYQRLDRLDLLKSKANYWPELGLAILVLIIVALLFTYIRQNELAMYANNVPLLMLLLIYFLTIVAMKIVSMVQSLEYPFIGYIAPVAMGSVLITILINERMAYISALLFGVLSSIIFNLDHEQMFDFRFGLVFIVASYIAIFSIQRANRRATILRAGLLVSLFSAVSVAAIILLHDHSSKVQMMYTEGFAIAGGLLTAVLVIGLMPFFEASFGILSPLKLLELSNPNHPLLRKLLTETPGTYHHSVMVGNLSEAAAESIGADGLLCRVGSFYHDIGKTKRPSYFIENQTNIENPHDRIDPGLSKSIIIAHARDGVEMLKEYKIPKAIRDIAEQHHGTTLLQFFYHKAQKLREGTEGKPIKESDYRYFGPKAQTKESAIVGIADSVEAAVRSLRNPTIEQIDTMVQKIIKSRLDDGQFNECDLTLKELDIVGKTLKETLLGIFHSRIEYPPELNKNDELKGAKEA